MGFAYGILWVDGLYGNMNNEDKRLFSENQPVQRPLTSRLPAEDQPS